jgi:hypothetical protein
MIYGGTIKPGHSTVDGGVLDIVSAFQSYGGGEEGFSWGGGVQMSFKPYGGGEGVKGGVLAHS